MDIPTMKKKVDKKINEKSGKQEHSTFCYTKDQLAEIMNRLEVLIAPGNEKMKKSIALLTNISLPYHMITWVNK